MLSVTGERPDLGIFAGEHKKGRYGGSSLEANYNLWKDLTCESNDVKLLGVTVDRDLKFDKHVLKLCTKANQKLSALSRMANLLSFNKRTLFKAFVESQFKYCPIVWRFHRQCTNNKINMLHERAFRIVYDDNFWSIIRHKKIFLYSPSKYPETLN